jgi:hypothetical protein
VIHQELTATRLEARKIRVHCIVDVGHKGKTRRILVEVKICRPVALARIVLERHVAEEVETEGVDQLAARGLKARQPNGPVGFRTFR